MATEQSSLAPQRPSAPAPTQSDAIYYDAGQTPRAKCLQYTFVSMVTICVLICIILSIVQGVKHSDGGMYFMLGISLVGFVVLEMILIFFIRRGELPKEKSWFLYFLGGCIILESIFTDVLLYN